MNLERAIEIAVQAHKGQVDKAGEPYILHPLRVMMNVESKDAKIVAMLHDVIEDTNITLANLAKEGFNEDILQAIDCLTKRKSEKYFDYIQRIKEMYDVNRLPLIVKLADLEDNMNLSRLHDYNEKDLERCEKYRQAREMLVRS